MTSIQGLDALQRKLKTLEQFQRKMKPPVDKSMKLLQREWGKKPRKKKGAFTAMATDKQRRAYWARVGSGEAEHREGVGYLRTDQIINSVSSKTAEYSIYEIKAHSNGVRGELGTNAPGAKWVIGDKSQQQPFHTASGWQNIDDVIDAKSDSINELFQAVIKRELNK